MDEIKVSITTAADLAAAKEAKSTLEQLAVANKAAEAAAKSRAESSMTISAAEVQASAKVTTSLEEQLVAWRALKAEREANLKITDASGTTADGRPSSIPQTIAMTGSGLATQAPALNETAEAAKAAEAEVAAFNITTEAEYLAIKKASDAIADKLPVLKAAGVETVALEATQAKYAAALSGTTALEIEAALAHRRAARELAGETEATQAHTIAMREAMVLTRELSTGNISRAPGSLGLLLSSLGLKGAGVLPALTSASIGFFALESIFRKIKENTEAADKAFEDFMSKFVHIPSMVGDLNGVRQMMNEIAENTYKYNLEIGRVSTQTNALQVQAQHTTEAINAQFAELTAHEEGEIRLLNTRVDLMRTLGLISDDQSRKEHAQIELQAAKDKMVAENARDTKQIAADTDIAKQAIIKRKPAEDAKAAADKAAADAKREADNHAANLATNQAALEEYGIEVPKGGKPRDSNAAVLQQGVQDFIGKKFSIGSDPNAFNTIIEELSKHAIALADVADTAKRRGDLTGNAFAGALANTQFSSSAQFQLGRLQEGPFGTSDKDISQLVTMMAEFQRTQAKEQQIISERDKLRSETQGFSDALTKAQDAAKTATQQSTDVVEAERKAVDALRTATEQLYGTQSPEYKKARDFDPTIPAPTLTGDNVPGAINTRQSEFDQQFKQSQLNLANENLQAVLKNEKLPQIISAGTTAIDKLKDLENHGFLAPQANGLNRIENEGKTSMEKPVALQTDLDKQHISRLETFQLLEKQREDLLNVIRELGAQGGGIADAIRTHSANYSPGRSAGTGEAPYIDKGSLAGEQYMIEKILDSIRRQNKQDNLDHPGLKIPGFAEGGYTGDGDPSQVAGVVHKGEIVVPADIVAKYKNKMPQTTEEWAEFDKANRDMEWQSKNAGMPETTAGWAAHDAAKSNADWEALNQKYGGNNPTTASGWAAKDAASRNASWNEQFGTQAKIDEINKRDNAGPGPFFEDEFGGPDWQEKAKKRADAAAQRIADWHDQRGDIDNGDGTWTSRDHKKAFGTSPAENARYEHDFPHHATGASARHAAANASQSASEIFKDISKTLNLFPALVAAIQRKLVTTNGEVSDLMKQIKQNRIK